MKADNHLPHIHQQLVQQVQYNCDISDANHAGDYTLCIYLLKMREYYRWIHALEFSDNFDADSITGWLRSKEDIWDRVADEEFRNIHLANSEYDPFDTHGINRHLFDDSLFYHAGIGQKAVQHFFIADLVDSNALNGTQISITGKEYARDLTAPPAISTHNEIIVRQESLKRMCWERYQEWNWNRLENPMGTAMSYYPFEDDIPSALDQMVSVEQNTLIQHELGEMKISQRVGGEWPTMMLKLLGSKAELLARAVRDHLADCLHTLPFLIDQANPASIHFYFANLTYIRKDMFPSAMQAYHDWCEHEDPQALTGLNHTATEHWQNTLHEILEIGRRNEENPGPEIIALVEQSHY